MRPCVYGSSLARLAVSLAVAGLLVCPSLAQNNTAGQPAATRPVSPPATDPSVPESADPNTDLSDVPLGTPLHARPPNKPVGPPDLKKMSVKQIAALAAYNIALIEQAIAHYTYKESEHMQNYIDGKLVVDHTTVTENVFINNLPYMQRILVDGKPLEGKELKAEQKLYDQTVKERKALDATTRAMIQKHALRSTTANIDRLAADFDLKLDGHDTINGQDCIILDAMPKSGNTDPGLAQHVRIALEADSGDVLDVNVEFLADANGFSKGSDLHTRYKIVGAVPLPDFQTWDSVVRFKELLDRPITIHRVRTFTEYKRFSATVTIESVKLADETPSGPDTPAGTDAPAMAPVANGFGPSATARTPALTPAIDPKEKAQADAKAREDARLKAEADAKAKADEKAKAREDARVKAEAGAKAKADARAKAQEEANAKAEERAKEKEEARVKAEVDAKARADAKAQAEAEAKVKAQADAEAKAKARAETAEDAKARAEADAQAKAEAKAKAAELAKLQAEDKARARADAKEKAEELAKIKAEERSKDKEAAKERADAEAQAKADAKVRALEQAKEKAEAEAQAKARAASSQASGTPN